MTKITIGLALLMFAAAGNAQTGLTTGDAGSKAPRTLAAASDYEPTRYRDSEDSVEQGPLSVHVTTFDSSPTTPGMWYQKPRRDPISLAIPDGPSTPRTPFDRSCGPAGCD